MEGHGQQYIAIIHFDHLGLPPSLEEQAERGLLAVLAFDEDLPTSAAGAEARLDLFAIRGDNRHGLDGDARELGACGEGRDPLGAKAGREGHVFLVAADDNLAVGEPSGGAHVKAGVRRISLLGSGEGCAEQGLVFLIDLIQVPLPDACCIHHPQIRLEGQFATFLRVNRCENVPNLAETMNKNLRFVLTFKVLTLLFFGISSGAFAQEAVTFNYTGAVQTYTVPPCVSQIQVTLKGGAGGGANGGNGATVTATLDVMSGDVLEVRVGGEGECFAGGWNGGGDGANASPFASRSCGGGGGSDIRQAPYGLGDRLAIAAGGGGMGGGTSDGDGGNGGCSSGVAGENTFGDGGGPGTAFMGGFGGAAWAAGGNSGANGVIGAGGDGGSDPCGSNAPGGGGGGGRFGGGGGGSDCVTFTSSVGGGGGGGGSSLTPPGGSCVAGNVSGDGSVTITPIGGIGLSISPANPFFCEGGEVNIALEGADTYEWLPADGISDPNSNEVVASPDSTTTYSIYVTTPECEDTVDVTVVVVPYPVLTIDPPYPTTCNDEQAVITVTGANAYQWTPATGLNTTFGSTVIATPEETTTYTITGTTTGCSTDTTVTVGYAITVAQEIYFCEGSTYVLPDGVIAETPGDYTSSLVSVAGCDSIILTDLIETPLYQLSQEIIICQDDPYYLPDDTTLVTESGTYVTVLPSAIAGCDSTITTVAEVVPTIYTEYAYDICEGQYVNIPGGGQADTTGIYEIVYTSAVTGCDSTAQYDITVHPAYEDELIEATLCSNEPYVLPDGDLAEESGVFAFNLQSVWGCDSSIILNLTLQPAYELVLNETICNGDSYTLPDGSSVSNAGTYFFENVTTLGCDSNYTVNLAVQDIPFVSPNIAPSYCPELTTIPIEPVPPGGTLSGPFVAGGQLNHTAASPGNYEVTYTYFDQFGCGGSTTSAYIIPEPFDDLAFTPEIKCNRVVLTPNALSDEGLLTYAWSFDGDLVEVAAIADYPFMTTGTYSIELELTDEFGCTYGVTQVEELESEFDLANFYIPNVITPNRDGDNEILQFNGVANECLRYELSIFNRWGKRVYVQRHDKEPFAGEDENGDPLADGMYYYTLETIDLDCGSTPELRDYCSGTLQIFRSTE